MAAEVELTRGARGWWKGMKGGVAHMVTGLLVTEAHIPARQILSTSRSGRFIGVHRPMAHSHQASAVLAFPLSKWGGQNPKIKLALSSFHVATTVPYSAAAIHYRNYMLLFCVGFLLVMSWSNFYFHILYFLVPNRFPQSYLAQAWG